MAFMEGSAADMLIKVVVFALVQVLVFLILKSSSDVFSKNKMRSLSFKPARSASIRRILAVISDLPAGGEVSSRSSRACWHPVLENMPLLMRINTKSSSAFHSWLWQLGVCLGIDSFVL
ncbi:hypothetical protein CK203_100153 [Vitis vinifera]|uniref:Uncharacterized protein n=1 Tax=Vitis vinifera TaxID=29760 RepID=A0A438DBJ6_VITVI|nr:hypothetical protein CK203_100153 [Vitis vinifera]